MELQGPSFDLGSSLTTWLKSMPGIVTELNSPFWWPTLAIAAVGAVAIVYARSRDGLGARPLATARVGLFLRELRVDVACFLANSLLLTLMAPILFWVTVAGTAPILLTAGMPSQNAGVSHTTGLVAVTALSFVFSDFALYWSHRIFHSFERLWRIHQLHHRPRVLTPITAFRFWPHEQACHYIAFNFGEGIAFGIASQFMGTDVSPMKYAGVNVFLLAWALSFSHLRHSHFPLYFPRLLSYLLISPHMHQVHHSIDPRHHHGNFGTALAIWDWMFGTLVIPDKNERFQFGLKT